uniref:Uncharacterized protein n=1 Tax=Clytia hemisphaerica TaxID=252671 RepID=A0A7M5VDQ2_9CNID
MLFFRDKGQVNAGKLNPESRNVVCKITPVHSERFTGLRSNKFILDFIFVINFLRIFSFPQPLYKMEFHNAKFQTFDLYNKHIEHYLKNYNHVYTYYQQKTIRTCHCHICSCRSSFYYQTDMKSVRTSRRFSPTLLPRRIGVNTQTYVNFIYSVTLKPYTPRISKSLKINQKYWSCTFLPQHYISKFDCPSITLHYINAVNRLNRKTHKLMSCKDVSSPDLVDLHYITHRSKSLNLTKNSSKIDMKTMIQEPQATLKALEIWSTCASYVRKPSLLSSASIPSLSTAKLKPWYSIHSNPSYDKTQNPESSNISQQKSAANAQIDVVFSKPLTKEDFTSTVIFTMNTLKDFLLFSEMTQSFQKLTMVNSTIYYCFNSILVQRTINLFFIKTTTQRSTKSLESSSCTRNSNTTLIYDHYMGKKLLCFAIMTCLSPDCQKVEYILCFMNGQLLLKVRNGVMWTRKTLLGNDSILDLLKVCNGVMWNRKTLLGNDSMVDRVTYGMSKKDVRLVQKFGDLRHGHLCVKGSVLGCRFQNCLLIELIFCLF